MWQAARLMDSYRGELSEDRADVFESGPNMLTIVVADGVGGREYGGEAAEKAVALVRAGVLASNFKTTDPRSYYFLLTEIDRALLNEDNTGNTTLIVATLTPKRIVGASVGDSEAWWVNEGGHFDLTGGQERKPFMGSGGAVPVPFSLPTPAEGTLLVASDGLFNYSPPETISATIATGAENLEALAERVARLVRPRGHLYDDLAIVLCQRAESETAAPESAAARMLRRLFPTNTAPAPTDT